jgi:hypothetical protein
MFKWFNLKTFLTGLIFSSVLIGWLALYRANHPHHQGASIPTCHSAGQIIAGSQCSPAPGVTNGRYVCRAKGAALETVCEQWGTKVQGGIVYHEGKTIPPSIGTIRCNKDSIRQGDEVSVTIVGDVANGLIGAQAPLSSWAKIQFGMDGGDCWNVRARCYEDTLSGSISVNISKTRFTPRVTDLNGVSYFDLTKWTIAGDCVREGCGMCRDGENCVDADAAECIVSSVKDEPRH